MQLAGEKITGKQEETFQSLAMQKGKERIKKEEEEKEKQRIQQRIDRLFGMV